MVEDAGESVSEASPSLTLDRQRDEFAELSSARRDLAAAVSRQIDFYVEHYKLPPHEAATKARQALPFDPADRPADQVSWWELSTTLDADPDQGQALWGAIKDEAREELATGFRAARSVEPSAVSGRPLDRAQFRVIVEALDSALKPRDGLEHLLIQQMAAAHEMHLRWQARAVQRAELEAWRGDADRRRELERMSPAQRERYEAVEGWVPPRLSETEAIAQAVMIADRYQRSFLRLLKAFRDTRRVIGAVVVAEGGTLNVSDGPQQVNVNPPARQPRRRPITRRPRVGAAAPPPGA